MTYYYKTGQYMAIATKDDIPYIHEYVYITPDGFAKHIKNNTIIESRKIKSSNPDYSSQNIARSMLFPVFRKKKTSKSKTRKCKRK